MIFLMFNLKDLPLAIASTYESSIIDHATYMHKFVLLDSSAIGEALNFACTCRYHSTLK